MRSWIKEMFGRGASVSSGEKEVSERRNGLMLMHEKAVVDGKITDGMRVSGIHHFI